MAKMKEKHMAGKTTTKSKASKAKAAEPEELEGVDEVDGDEVEATETTKKADDVVFGAADLAKLLSEKSGKTVTTRELRTLIRKMARDGQGRVNREIVPGNRTRYSWSGPKDPEVVAIIAAFEGGELEADKKAKLEELKANKAAKKAAGEPVGKKAKAKAEKEAKKGKGKKAQAEAAAVESEDDDELELDD